MYVFGKRPMGRLFRITGSLELIEYWRILRVSKQIFDALKLLTWTYRWTNMWRHCIDIGKRRWRNHSCENKLGPHPFYLMTEQGLRHWEETLMWCHMGYNRTHNLNTWYPPGSLYKHGLAVISSCISNPIQFEVWDEIAYPLPNFNSAGVEVCDGISNFIPHLTGHLITYPCWD